MSTEEYKSRYSKPIESESVKQKREKTSMEKYGEKHYTNREAAKFSYLAYEGGHPFKDPECRNKALKTKEKLYGNPNYTNRDKAKKTNLERYGTEHTCAAKEVIDKRLSTLKERYGKVFNVDEPHNKTHPPESFKQDCLSGILIEDLSNRYGVSSPTIKRWIDDLGISRSKSKSGVREILSPEEIVLDYLDTCYSTGKSLSFYDYGKHKGSKYCNKLKRLFNKGKKFEEIKPLLLAASSDKGLKYDVLQKMREA
jgi:hypothetical protein